MPLIVPLQPVASQSLNTVLNNQNVQLNVYQKLYGLFMDVYLNDVLVIAGVLCENLNLIVRSAYLGFSGDFIFMDNQAAIPQAGEDPSYTGLGSQFFLLYLFPADLPTDLSAEEA
jgi:hypothetical protein